MTHEECSQVGLDYSKIVINRMHDKSSPGAISLRDRLRTAWRLRSSRITAGDNVVIKQDVKIDICESGHLHFGDNVLVHAGVWLLLTMPGPKVDVGDWVNIGKDTVIAAKGGISIGAYTIFAPRCYIIDVEHGFSASDVILNQRSIIQPVTIGRDCYFGTGTVVLSGATVGDGVIVGANSVVTKDIPAGQVWAGNPAKYIKDRV